MKKSLKAKIVSQILKKTSKKEYSVTKEEAHRQFEEELAAGEQPYEMPKVKFKSSVFKKDDLGMGVYYINAESAVKKTVFYYHGGGFVHRPHTFHWRFADKLAQKTGAKVIFPVYPLAPFHTYKELFDKSLALYKSQLTANPDDEIIFMGDSAGAGFVISFYQFLLEKGMRTPDKTVAMSPWVDIATDNPEMENYAEVDAMLVQSTAQVWAELWAGDGYYKNYMLSPTFYDKLHLLKNVHLYVGTAEIFYPDVKAFFKKIKDNPGCTLTVGDKMNHVYPLYPIPEAKKAFEEISKFVEQ